MAASGLRISCATAADMRPMAASFSVRMRASSSRRSCRNITHRLSMRGRCGGVSRVRTRTCARRRAGLCERRSRCDCGAAPREGAAAPARPAAARPGAASSANGQRHRAPGPGPRDRVGGRVGRVHAAVGVDHQHAFAERLDHQVVDLRLHARARCGCAAPPASSRASRAASWWASSATTKKPVPVSAACTKRAASRRGCCEPVPARRRPAAAA